MFKGVVMEIKDKYVIVMKEDATFIKINKKEGLSVGKSIFFFEEDVYNKLDERKVIPFKKGIIPMIILAATIMLILLPKVNFLENPANPYAILTVDINPSVEFSLDKSGEIIKANGVNNEANDLSLDKVKGMTLEEGILFLKNELTDRKYLNDKSNVLIGFSFLDEDDLEYESKVKDTMKNSFSSLQVAYLKGSKEDIKEAENRGLSLGKYEALMKLDEDQLEDELEKMNTQEILELLKNRDSSIFLNEELLDEVEDRYEDVMDSIQDYSDDDD